MEMTNTTETVSKDWRGTNDVKACLKYLRTSSFHSDIEFVFPAAKDRLPAHRLILSMRSAVFETMFFGSLSTKDSEVTIDDIEPAIFNQMLGYIYTDEIDLNGVNVLKCIYAAKKYCLEALLKKCSDFLELSISSDNVCIIHEQAVFYEMVDLKRVCFQRMILLPDEVFKSKGFLSLPRETITNILDSNVLSTDEIRVVKSIIMWAKHQITLAGKQAKPEEIRHFLGDLIAKIRFPVLSMESFATEVAPTGILTKDDQLAIYQYFATMASRKPDAKTKVGKFLTYQRNCESVLTCCPDLRKLEVYPNTPMTEVKLIISFMNVSAKINLKSITGNLGEIKGIALMSGDELRWRQDSQSTVRFYSNINIQDNINYLNTCRLHIVSRFPSGYISEQKTQVFNQPGTGIEMTAELPTCIDSILIEIDRSLSNIKFSSEPFKSSYPQKRMAYAFARR